jgi:1-aminocyclopropane-1-carboxylate deaminase/D-cysteine desulfhydrase-like pyridoxal-dependent ACC family enzyme
MNAPHARLLDPRDGLELGSYPTPLWKVSGVGEAEHDLWIKDDGATAKPYGGNKVRKLERLLSLARQRKAARLLTVGAAGSHHVLATCLYGSRVGLRTHAILTPQPWTGHAEATLRAGLNAGLSAAPARSYLDALVQLRRERRAGDFIIGPGGMGSEGTWAYCLAVDELQKQLQQHALPELDAIIVAAGSGSTAAGLLAGVLRTGVARRIIAVQVAPNPLLRALVIGQTSYALWRHDQRPRPFDAWRSLCVDGAFVGRGYGYPSEAGEHASELARSFGLALEPTYTAKAFAAALSLTRDMAGASAGGRDNPTCKLRLHRRRTYLYWHTLSAVPLDALLTGAPEALPPNLGSLLHEPSPNPS